MNKESIKELAKGKFFSVEFTKKDGSLRKMTCRLGVKKHLKGGKSTITKPNLMTVFEVGKGYRCINTDNIRKFKCGKVNYENI